MFALHPVLVCPLWGRKEGRRKERVLPWDGRRMEAPKKGERERVLAASKSTLVASTRGILMCALSFLTGKGGTEAH